MKLRLLLLALIGIMLACESKNHQEDITPFQSIGAITGIDNRLCPCCSGYIIEIAGEDGEYRIGTTPEDFQINEDDFPISIRFNWDIQATCEGIGISNINIIDFQLN